VARRHTHGCRSGRKLDAGDAHRPVHEGWLLRRHAGEPPHGTAEDLRSAALLGAARNRQLRRWPGVGARERVRAARGAAAALLLWSLPAVRAATAGTRRRP